jgi:hypothetical protein
VENHSPAWNISSGTSAHVCQSVGIRTCKKADLPPFQDTKEKPFHCACGKSFSRNDLLKRHRLREHSNDDATPSCPSSRATAPPSPAGMADVVPTHASTLEHLGKISLPLGSVGNVPDVTNGTTGIQHMYTVPNVFEEFTTFIGDAGLEPSWDGMDLSMFDTANGQSDPTTMAIPIATVNTRAHHVTASEDLIDDDFAGLTPHETYENNNPSIYQKATTHTWHISEAERQNLSRKIAEASYPPCPIIQLPSKHALTRYFQSYADGLHKHFPMLHMPTYKIAEGPPELTLAIAAVGAQYRFEFLNGLELYQKARHMTMGRIGKCQNHTLLPDTAAVNPTSNCGATDNICTIVLLMVFALWRDDIGLLSEALQLQAPLAHALRQDGLSESHVSYENTNWDQWIQAERRRRTKLIAFAYLNLQVITYNTPPLVFGNEIDLLLPCSSAEWETKTPSDWRQSIIGRQPPVSFQEGLRYLLVNPRNPESLADRPWTSPLALFILLQAVLQNIMLARHLQLPGDTALHAGSLDLLECVPACHECENPC